MSAARTRWQGPVVTDPLAHALAPEHPDAGPERWMGGISARTLVPAAATGGAYSVVEHRLRARELIAPLHRHSREDEVTVVVQGRIGVVAGDRVLVAGPGEVVRKPRGEWHTFFNAGDAEARVLEIVSPPGLEEYFAELARYFPTDAPPDLDAVADASDRYGIEMDPDSLAGLVERFGLARPPELDGA